MSKKQENSQPTRGRPQSVVFTPDDLAAALLLWSSLPHAQALTAIQRKTGKSPNRNRMNYLARKHDIR
jgi:hypothetical protein